jgi:hypothetical protein
MTKALELQLRVLSLGAGVQSTTLALMASRGDVGPMPDCAIFADTGAEPAAVYRHLDWLERELPFPVHRVSAGNLRDEIVGAMAGSNRMDARPPFFTASGGLLRRQCTQDFKIVPIIRKVRELIGLAKGQRAPRVPVVEQWIGISMDEAIRMKPSRLPFIRHRWPLIEKEMHRRHCLAWCEERQYPKPAKSACTFCPYTSNDRWRELRDHDPEAFADAVAIDRIIRPGVPGPKRPKGDGWFVHRDLVPLDQVDLSTDAERGQADLFNDECEGMCGV